MWLDTLKAGDRVNLLELYARSVMLIELGRAADWVELFEPSAVLRCMARGASESPGARQFKGKSELLELARRMIAGEFDLAAGALAAGSHCRHTLTDISLFSDGAHGAVTGYAHVTVTATGNGGPPRWLASGTYSDHLVGCSVGCWRFGNRVLSLDALSSSDVHSMTTGASIDQPRVS